jgi:hypothetical protein
LLRIRLSSFNIDYGKPAALQRRAKVSQTKPAAEAEILERLMARFGELIGPAHLWKELGFGSPAAARTARRRRQFPVPAFKIKNRRGYFAHARDVALWLARPQRTFSLSVRDGEGAVNEP